MRLVDVYDHPDAVEILFRLLKERPPIANISHKRMPTKKAHKKFVDSRPYDGWYLIEEGEIVGAVYLTDRSEIGIGIFRKFQHGGRAQKAIRLLMEQHPRKCYYANVAPGNEASIRLFKWLGFKHIQNTYECST